MIPALPFDDDRVSVRLTDRLAFAHDASLYRYVPNVVFTAHTTDDIQRIFAWCRDHQRSVTFRAGGTSLSGQALAKDTLVRLGNNWNNVDILDDGALVRMGPGITGARVNAKLRAYGRKIGPDPASILAAQIGGIVANNASGMCCGTAMNSYATLHSMVFVLANGVRIDTSDPHCDVMLQDLSPDISHGLISLRNELRSNPELVDRIRRKYAIKNTVGYSLHAFLDEDEPTKILARLLVGSEGTLGFIESVTLRTVADARIARTAFIVYDSIEDACADIPRWRDSGAAAVEILDDVSLRSFATLPSTPEKYRVYRPDIAALIVEYHDMEPPLPHTNIEWTDDDVERATIWRLRKGLMPTIGAIRPAGSTMINEDIAVPPESLAGLIKDVRAAFRDFNYDDGVIFGHAKDGNIHFVVNVSMDSEADIHRYAQFMERIVEIVVDEYAGSLKAEHGTGRNMAPFVEREWGSAATDIMWRVKRLLDPMGILNPDVVLSSDPTMHVQNIKPIPTLQPTHSNDTTDRCIECGFCETVCPSSNLTLSPRRRIVLRRERELHRSQPTIVQEIDKAWRYDGDATCAADSMCSFVCPVGIDTGMMVKGLRAQRTNSTIRRLTKYVASHMQIADAAASLVTTFQKKWGRSPNLRRSTSLQDQTELIDVLYIPSCPSRWFGQNATFSLPEIVERLSVRAGIHCSRLSSMSYCCGQPFESKGYTEAATMARRAMLAAIHLRTKGQRPDILIDTSTCAASLQNDLEQEGYRVIDQTQFALRILTQCPPRHTLPRLVSHAGCGSHKLGTTTEFVRVLKMCADQVIVPSTSPCCGMGGDVGIRHPELPTSALRELAHDIVLLDQSVPTLGVVPNTMCASALREATGVNYVSLLQIVELVTSDDGK